jgi:nicotinate dehydrogenase subunit B
VAFDGDLSRGPYLDSWIRLGPDGRVTVLTGKVELGQGIKTALIQVAAEELDIDPARLTLITADTARTPDEGYTAGSHSMPDSGTAIRDAAAELRGLLVGAAAARWNLPADQLATGDGRVSGPAGRSLSYGELAGAVDPRQPARPPYALKPPERFTLVGRSMPRVDIPAKLTGIPSYVQDLSCPAWSMLAWCAPSPMAGSFRRWTRRRPNACPACCAWWATAAFSA